MWHCTHVIKQVFLLGRALLDQFSNVGRHGVGEVLNKFEGGLDYAWSGDIIEGVTVHLI